MEAKTEVLFNPFPKQIEFLEAVFSGRYQEIFYGGAIRGGKTFAGLGALLLLCKKYPKSRWAIVRDNLQTLKRNTIPSFNKICPQAFIKSYNQDTQTVTFNNGSQIIFFSENYNDDKELNRWKGLEVSGFLLEEVNELQEKSYYKAIERAGTLVIPNKPPKLIISTCNPANNWVKEMIYDRWIEGSLPQGVLYIPSKIFDNPYIVADTVYMESLKRMPRYEYETFVEGNWDIQERTGAEFYKEFNIDIHVKDLSYDPELPLWISIDENVNPYFPATVWQILGKEARCIDEIALRNPNNTVSGFTKEVKRRYGNHKFGIIITGDATSRKEDVKVEKGYNLFRLIENDLLQLHPQVRVPPSNPAVIVRQQFMNHVLFNQAQGNPWMGLKFFIDSKCKLTIQDYQNVKEETKNGKTSKHKEIETDSKSGISYQKLGHMSDTGDYLMCYAFSSEYADYQRGGPSFGPTMGATRSIRRF